MKKMRTKVNKTCHEMSRVDRKKEGKEYITEMKIKERKKTLTI